MGIEQLTKDILKTLELYSDQNGFNNAAALLADNNHFKGIDIIRFGDSIDEIMERKSVDKIPEKAFREAVANALVHRMWDIPASIKISMYSDKIEISSPGGLPAGLSEDEYLTESSKSPASIARSNKQWVGLACIRRGTSPS